MDWTWDQWRSFAENENKKDNSTLTLKMTVEISRANYVTIFLAHREEWGLGMIGTHRILWKQEGQGNRCITYLMALWQWLAEQTWQKYYKDREKTEISEEWPSPISWRDQEQRRRRRRRNSLVVSHTKTEYKDDVWLRSLPRLHATTGRQKLTEYCIEINLSNEDPSLVL